MDVTYRGARALEAYVTIAHRFAFVASGEGRAGYRAETQTPLEVRVDAGETPIDTITLGWGACTEGECREPFECGPDWTCVAER